MPLLPADPCLPPKPQSLQEDASKADELERLAAQAFTAQEGCLRQYLENAFVTTSGEPPAFGIALSGGGSKAAAFAMGVLAGLSDVQLLDRANYLSSVSGGSYAAYFYYAHRLFPLVRRHPQRLAASNEDLFRDCVALPGDDHATQYLIDAIRERVPYCGRQSLHTYIGVSPVPSAREGYQAFVKCTQDLMRPGDCNTDATSSWRKGVSLPTLGGSLATVIPSLVSNTLFDWGLASSPSANSYRDGIGLAYGASLADARDLKPGLVTKRTKHCDTPASPDDRVFDCKEGFFDPDPKPMTFDELRAGLLEMRKPGRDGMPFWILNATATEFRSVYGWLRKVREDTTNSDMFEMTAVSHGSGRYGYVSAPAAIHDMTVLDGVLASAAFLDANQLVHTNRVVRFGAALGLHFANLDWGIDIANYNVSTKRRLIHRSLPFPFYYVDSMLAGLRNRDSTAMQKRERENSVFIRLIDGGNAENLGVYSLLKRKVRNILIADAAADDDGQFADLCGLRRRVLQTPPGLLPMYVHFPGLRDFDTHCDGIDSGKKVSGYDLHAWFTDHPLLLGCIRRNRHPNNAGASCHGLSGDEVRLIVAKPAIKLADFIKVQLANVPVKYPTVGGETHLVVSDCWIRDKDSKPTTLLNCDTAGFLQWNHDKRKGDCPIFPQHSTVLMTANSSVTLFVAYRELARQYIRRDAEILRGLVGENGVNPALFEQALEMQAAHQLVAAGPHCQRY